MSNVTSSQPELSVIIVSWNTRQMLLDCIASILRHAGNVVCEVIAVDNASTDGSAEAVSGLYPDVHMVRNASNLGFARANNIGIERMKGRYAVLLNSDTLIRESALEKLHAFMERTPSAGICGPRLLNADGSNQKSYGVFPTLISEFTSKSVLRLFFPAVYRRLFAAEKELHAGPAQVDFIIGACMVVRKDAIEKVGPLDPEYHFYYEEIDWCHRMRQEGWGVYHVPDAKIVHFGGGSTQGLNLKARAESWRSRYLFFQKSLKLKPWGRALLYAAGCTQVAVRFLGYFCLNLLTLFAFPRLRNRFRIFGYLLLWHVRGFPDSMGLPGERR